MYKFSALFISVIDLSEFENFARTHKEFTITEDGYPKNTKTVEAFLYFFISLSFGSLLFRFTQFTILFFFR